MNIIFTKHALQKLEQRNISKTHVLETIAKCTKIIYDKGKYYAFRKYGRRYLKVVFKRDGSTTIIITQHYIKDL